MRCPKCGTDLEAAELDHISIHDCPKCKGMWFGRDELRRVKDSADPDLSWLDFDVFSIAERENHGTRPCAECGKPMAVMKYPHSKVCIDVCPDDHGIWLDRSEFDGVMKALEKIANTMSTGDLEKETLRQLEQVVTGPKSRVAEIKDFLAVFRLLRLRFALAHPASVEAVNELARLGV